MLEHWLFCNMLRYDGDEHFFFLKKVIFYVEYIHQCLELLYFCFMLYSPPLTVMT